MYLCPFFITHRGQKESLIRKKHSLSGVTTMEMIICSK